MSTEPRLSSRTDNIGTRVSLATVIGILTGYAVALGLERISNAEGFWLLVYGGFLTISGMAMNRMPVFAIGVSTTAGVMLFHAVSSR